MSAEEWDNAAPRPAALIQSLRAFGYSPATALADLVDNSISAGATKIVISFHWAGEDSHVALVDNGGGMKEDVLVEAMRLGSANPLDTRAPKDLGRFGLGLKTASFSQARELTVITRAKRGRLAVRRWDLDVVGQTGEWRLLRSACDATQSYLDHVESLGGTAVVWTKCDRLVGDVLTDPDRAADRFLKTAEQVRRHLGMTFHRFISGRSHLNITVNDNLVFAWEPIIKNSATHQLAPPERLSFRGSEVRVTAFVLPHRSKLSADEQAAGSGIRGWTAQQGFYVYRNSRLLVPGDWLGLGFADDEHTKLARIIVDFDSALDLDWQIDVKKSTARPPGPLVADLRRIAAATRRAAEEVYRHRGAISLRQKKRDLVFAWHEVKDRLGGLRLKINREHPIIRDALSGPRAQKLAVERVLRFAEETVPTTLIGVRLSESLDAQPLPYKDDPTELQSLLKYSVDVMMDSGVPRRDVLIELGRVEPFASHPQVLQAMLEAE